MPDRHSILDRLVTELRTGRIESVAFVVVLHGCSEVESGRFPSDVRWTLPLYDLAITTARRGWQLGIPAATYWFVTPEPEPLASLGAEMGDMTHQSLEPEGITFIGSTYADVQGGVVLLDPQGECIQPDRIVSLDESGELLLDGRAPEVTSATQRSPANGASQRRSVAAQR